jgi:hypothetical protein
LYQPQMMMMRSMEHLVESELAGELKFLDKTCSINTLSTTDPTLPDLGSNPDHIRGHIHV